MTPLLWVCLGGAAGSGARWLLATYVTTQLGAAIYGTLAVNTLGSMLLGILMEIGPTSDGLPPVARLALITGVLGGFTTYSTFNYETLRYLEEGAWGYALAYVSATIIVCLVGAIIGVGIGRRVL